MKKPLKLKLNVRLLRAIQRQILKEPLQFTMETWFWSYPSGFRYSIPNCGTAACIAGWALAVSKKISPHKAKLNYYKTESAKLPDMAFPLLGVDANQGGRLFYFNRWPAKFKTKHQDNAKQAVARIEHFITTKGAE